MYVFITFLFICFFTRSVNDVFTSLQCLQTSCDPSKEKRLYVYYHWWYRLLLCPQFVFLVLTELICMSLLFALPGEVIILPSAFIEGNQRIHAIISICYRNSCLFYLCLHSHIHRNLNIVSNNKVVFRKYPTRTSEALTTRVVS